MKDFVMKLDKLSNQELEDRIEELIGKTIKALDEAVSRTCDAATKSPDVYGEVNADIEAAAGYARLMKSAATRAGLRMPEVTVFFGGGK